MPTFAYNPDPKNPSKAKLNISDARHTAAAVAALGKGFRGQKVSIPAADLPGVKAKVRAAYKKFYPDNDLPPILKSLDVKVNDSDITDPNLLSAIISSIANYFSDMEWRKQYQDAQEDCAEDALVEAGIIQPEVEEEPGDMSTMQIAKSKNEELRQGTFVVLEPDVVDLHGDTYNATEVSKGCHSFNVECRKAFIDHSVETDAASIVESYISPVDMVLDGEFVSKGTWVAVVQFDKELWKEVKKGTYDGLSIGAYCKTEDI